MKTPDRMPGPSDEEEIRFEDRTADGDPTVAGALRRLGDILKFKRTAGAALTLLMGPSAVGGLHETIRQAIHLADEGGPWEGFASGAKLVITPVADPFPNSLIWWTDAGQTAKIIEQTITYSGAFVTTMVTKVYDTDGTTVLITFTDTYAYNGAFLSSITRTYA